MIADAARDIGAKMATVGPSVEWRDRRGRIGLSALGIVLFVVLWQVITSGLALNPQYYPSPLGVIETLQRIWPPIVQVLPNTLYAAGAGFVFALVLSIAVAVPLVASDRLLQALMPLIIGINTVPRIAMTPLVIYWVGFFGGVPLVAANYVMATWVAFFPMLIAAIDGFRDIDESTENMLELYGASTIQEFRYVRLKAGLPFIFDGMKIGFILAMIGAVVGEFISGTPGIGSMAASAIGRTAVSRAVAVVLLLGLISTGVVLTIYVIESRVIFWRDSSIVGEP